jgi:hypothetical protein
MKMKGTGGGKYQVTNKIKGAVSDAKGNRAVANVTMPAASGPDTTAGKRLPPAPAKSAVAPKVSGSPGAPAKNPGFNAGGARKLGNHF